MTRAKRAAFTLVEMLVVIAIIVILIAILIPAIGAARQRAKIAGVQASFNALNAGIELLRGDTSIGGSYPPSRGDDATDFRKIADPQATNQGAPVETAVTGAHLLAFALVGADRLGPPGFKDINNNGRWSDDMHAFEGNDRNPAGLYGLDRTTGQAKWTRYGGGSGYVDESARERLKTINDLITEGTIPAGQLPGGSLLDTDASKRLPFFTDAWGLPILYYRATPSAKAMCGLDMGGTPSGGIYNQEDNGLITGTEGALNTTYNSVGIDFGAGPLADDPNLAHRIGKPGYVEAVPRGNNGDLTKSNFDNTFARFIWDKSITARNEPVRKDSYLLISAGPDLIYGTGDDIVNWQRQE
ncbi:MAG: hypothetical protein FLDDKLPJ_02536 [Phycisphaerae bacterium]|nr:hypothetical protein [Phycisphaerae bacterium]